MKDSAKIRVSVKRVNLEPAHSCERNAGPCASALGLLVGKRQSSVPENFLYQTFGSWKYRESQNK